MQKFLIKLSFIFAVLLLIFNASDVFGQQQDNTCLSDAQIKSIVAGINSGQKAAFDKKLANEFIELRKDALQFYQQSMFDGKLGDKEARRKTEKAEKYQAFICEVLAGRGWPSMDMIGAEGVSAMMYLLKKMPSLKLQMAIMPAILNAAQKQQIEALNFADYLDFVRLRAGYKQVFGTQIQLVDGFLELQPIVSEKKADEFRKQFGMIPLAEYLRNMERRFRIPLIKAPTVISEDFGTAKTISGAGLDGLESEGEPIRVDTTLVNINASVFDTKLRLGIDSLKKEDFKIFENGEEMEIGFFSETRVPFDLLLLIDLSGSTEDKRSLIRKGAQRFIEAARPGDRIGVFTFSDTVAEVSPLTENRTELIEKVEKIGGKGGSQIWEAVKYSLEYLGKNKAKDRRRSIVIMSDGIDSSNFKKEPPKLTYSELIETIRRSDVLINSVCITNFYKPYYKEPTYAAAVNSARNSMMRLAYESGGLAYEVDDLKDLKGAYERVLSDMAKVYTISYTPKKETRDGQWRSVSIKIPVKPDYIIRTRPGYFAQ